MNERGRGLRLPAPLGDSVFFLPTRSRPDEIRGFLASYHATESTAPVCVRIDADDPARAEYEKIEYPDNFEIVVGYAPAGGGSATLINEFYQEHPDLPWYGLLADDVRCGSVGWDRKLIEAAGHARVAYGPDGLCNRSCCTHPVLGGDLVREMGWIALPGVRHYFVDMVLFQTMKRAGLIRYVEDARLIHRPVKQEKRKSWAMTDRVVFDHFQRGGEMAALAERLKEKFADQAEKPGTVSIVTVVPEDRMTRLEWTLGLMTLRELLSLEGVSHQFLFFLAPIADSELRKQIEEKAGKEARVAYLDATKGFNAEGLVRAIVNGESNG